VILRRLGTVTVGPGPLTVAWDGTTSSGAAAFPGRYLAHVVAASSVGTSELTAPFLVRRQVPPVTRPVHETKRK
jgi:hypothetical protein